MKVLVTDYGKSREVDLEDVLTPQSMAYEFSGSMEEALGMARKNSQMLGKLAARMVESGLMSLEDALKAASCYDTVTLVEGTVAPWEAQS